MVTLFISHSSRDRDAAHRIRDWLQGWGYTDVDLDAEPERADDAGPPVRPADFERAAGVILLLSGDWVESTWCQRSFLLASRIGKRLFAVAVAPLPAGVELPPLPEPDAWIDLGRDDAEARLRREIDAAGLRPTDFPWPPADDPGRPAYRGLRTLGEEDAGIFFGRDREIVEVLDTLRRMHRGGRERVLAVVGRSGAGKSSFLRAGLLARLRRDSSDFLVLPLVPLDQDGNDEPSGAGFWRMLGMTAEPSSNDELRARLDEIRAAAPQRPSGAVTIVLPVDPGERLLSWDREDGVVFLRRCFAAAADLVVVLTLGDRDAALLNRFDIEPAVGVHAYRLPAPSLAAFQDIVEQPGARQTPPVNVGADLTSTLVEDLSRTDALPLLAFAIETLALEHRGDEPIDLSEYQRGLGGISAVINAAVTSVYEKALRDPSCPTNRVVLDELAKDTFIPHLVRIDAADAAPQRQVVAFDDLSARAKPFVRHLIAHRLLIEETRGGVRTVQIAHDAVIRNWWGLAAWLREERALIEQLEGLRRAAEAWDIGDRSTGMLAHRDDVLASTEALLKRPDLAQQLAGLPLEYLDACRANERQRKQRELRVQRRRDILRRAGNAFVLLLLGLACAGLFAAYQGARQTSEVVSAMLTRESRLALETGHPARALKLAVVAATETPLSPAAADARPQLARVASAFRPPTMLAGHEHDITTAAASSDARVVLTASIDGTARVWRWINSNEWRYDVLSGHDGAIIAAAFAPDGHRVVTGSADATARVWTRIGTDEWTSVTLGAHSAPVEFVYLSADGANVFTASMGAESVRRWHGANWQAETLDAPDGAFTRAFVSPEAKRVLVVGPGGRGLVYSRSKNGEYGVSAPIRHGKDILLGGFSGDGRRLVTAADDQTVRVWRFETGERWSPASIGPMPSTLTAVSLSVDGARLAAALATGEIVVGTRVRPGVWQASSIGQHDAAVSSIEWSPDGRQVLSASADGVIRIWHRLSGPEGWRSQLVGRHPGQRLVATYASGSYALTAASDGIARLWPLADSGDVVRLVLPSGRITAAAAAPDGRFFVTGLNDGSLRVWSPEGTAETLMGHSAAVTAVAVSPDGDRIASASRDGTALVWTKTPPRGWIFERLGEHPTGLVDATFTSTSIEVVTASVDGQVQVWRRGPGTWSVEILEGADAAARRVETAPDGRVLAVFADDTARVWNRASNGYRATVLTGVRTAVLDPVRERVFVGRVDGTLQAYDGRAHETPLGAHGGPIEVLAVADDGMTILSSSVDGPSVWRASKGGWVRDALGTGNAIDSATVLADGQRILTWTDRDDAAVRVYARSPEERWYAHRLPSPTGVMAAVSSDDGARIMTVAHPLRNGPAVARIWTDPSGAVPVISFEGRRTSLPQAVCLTKMAQAVGPSNERGPVRRPVAEVSAADYASNSEGWRAAGFRVGQDVCRKGPNLLDELLIRVLPREWWASRSRG